MDRSASRRVALLALIVLPLAACGGGSGGGGGGGGSGLTTVILTNSMFFDPDVVPDPNCNDGINPHGFTIIAVQFFLPGTGLFATFPTSIPPGGFQNVQIQPNTYTVVAIYNDFGNTSEFGQCPNDPVSVFGASVTVTFQY